MDLLRSGRGHNNRTRQTLAAHSALTLETVRMTFKIFTNVPLSTPMTAHDLASSGR